MESLILPLRVLALIGIAMATHLVLLMIRRMTARFARSTHREHRKLRSIVTVLTSVVVFTLYFFVFGLHPEPYDSQCRQLSPRLYSLHRRRHADRRRRRSRQDAGIRRAADVRLSGAVWMVAVTYEVESRTTRPPASLLWPMRLGREPASNRKARAATKDALDTDRGH